MVHPRCDRCDQVHHLTSRVGGQAETPTRVGEERKGWGGGEEVTSVNSLKGNSSIMYKKAM